MITTKPIDIEDAHADILQNAFKRHLPEGVHFYAFGSRANWQAKRASDLDLAVDANDVLKRNIGNLEEELSLSALPYKVDIVNLGSISDSFRKAIMNDLVPILWDWREVELGEVAEVIGGGTPKTSVAEYWNGDIPWLTPRDLTGYTDTYITKGERSISDLGLQRSSARLLTAGTVLLTSRAPIGYIALAKNIISTNQGFKNLVVNSEHAYNLFVYYWLKHNIKNLKAIGTGTTFMEISGAVVKAIRISLPPLPEQKAIASVLSSLDDKIDLLHRQNKTLESIAEVIFRKWFIEDADGSWEEGVIVDEFNLTMGLSPPGSSYNQDEIGVPMFQGNADFTFRFPNNRIYTNDPKRLAEQHDTLISVRAPVGDQNMAKEKCCIGRGVAAFRYKNNSNYYTYTYYKIKALMDEIKQFNETGTVFGSIGKNDFLAFEVTIPALKVVERFQNEIKPIDVKIATNLRQIKTLESLRNTLLPKLMSGSIRVKYEAS